MKLLFARKKGKRESFELCETLEIPYFRNTFSGLYLFLKQ